MSTSEPPRGRHPAHPPAAAGGRRGRRVSRSPLGAPGSSRLRGSRRHRPKRGGTLQVGLVGGSAATEQLDPEHLDGQQPRPRAPSERLLEARRLRRATARSTRSSPRPSSPTRTRRSWTVKLKKGVTWHDGSPLHGRRRRVLAAAHPRPGQQALVGIRQPDDGRPHADREGRRDHAHDRAQAAWSDLPTQLGQRYLAIVKNGTKTFTADTLVGTGPFKLTGWTPGTQTTLTAYSGYFESGKPYLDTVVLNGIDDPTARLNALQSGQVQAIEFVDPSQVKVLKASSSLVPLISYGRRLDADRDEHEGRAVPRRPRAPGDEAAGRSQQARQGRRAGLRLVGNDLFSIH